MSAATPLRIRISEVAITGGSGLEVRRLADALPASLDRAFAEVRVPGVSRHRHAASPADRAALQIAGVVRARLAAQE